jgi:hypothetical protein
MEENEDNEIGAVTTPSKDCDVVVADVDDVKIPRFDDWRNEFGDGEPFIVDGDALIARCLEDKDDANGGLVRWSVNRGVGGSSLHVVYLIEKALLVFKERGGNPVIVFFKRHSSMWNGDCSLRVLRSVVVRHFEGARDKTGVEVLSNFEAMDDKNFVRYLKEENVLMAVLAFPVASTKSTLTEVSKILFALVFHNFASGQ